MSSSNTQVDANPTPEVSGAAAAAASHNTTLPLIITVVLLSLLFLGFLSIYFCHFIMQYLGNAPGLRSANANTEGMRGGMSPQGLDPSILLSFPTMKYSEVKDLRQEKYGLECAVCLSEFQDNDELRLLPVCNHAFHPDCIDLWLKSHTTCPFCRCELDNPWEKLQEISIMIPADVDIDRDDDATRLDHMRRVSFKDEQDERWRNEGGLSAPMDESLGGHETAQRFSRSHSTGHSIIREDDRYTLRLPDNVKERIMRRHRYTGSCTRFGDYSGNVTVEKSGLGELSGTSHAIAITA